jgi:RHS repeat-associated protein
MSTRASSQPSSSHVIANLRTALLAFLRYVMVLHGERYGRAVFLWLTLLGGQASAQVTGQVNFLSVSAPASYVEASGGKANVNVTGTVESTVANDTVIAVQIYDGNTIIVDQPYTPRTNTKTEVVYNDPRNFAFTVSLAPGKHTITVSANTMNGSGALSYPVTVGPITPLAVNFSSPSSDQSLSTSGTSARVSFAGSATPTTASAITSLVLRDNGTQLASQAGGAVGAAVSFTAIKDLAVGTHMVNLSATDSGGGNTTVTRTITVTSTSSSTPTPTPTPTPSNPGNGTTTNPNIAKILPIIMDILLSDDGDTTQPPTTPAPAPTPPTPTGPTLAQIVVNELGNSVAGTLPGNLQVGNDGAATYSVELTVPPGTAGMQPKLSLDYSSNGPNGMVGLGWSLGGLSTIHRCGKTLAQDGAPGRIGFDTSDRLCLDGMRLLRSNGTNPGADLAAQDAAYWQTDPNAPAQFRTEIEGYAIVTRLANGFKVELKGGRIQYYGQNADASDTSSAIPARGLANETLLWALGRTEDRSGNYMTVQYATDAETGEYLPKQIRYGGNTAAGTSPDLAVRFSYETRPDAQIQYMGAARNDLRNRLTNIQLYINTGADGSGGTRVRDYIVRYTTSNISKRSLVESVQVCAATDNECLPITSMSWGSNPLKLVQTKAWREYVNGDNETSTVKSISGDFAGDGITTLLYPLQRFIRVGAQKTYFTDSMSGTPYSAKVVYPNTTDQYTAGIAGDLNGDGRDDLIFIDTSNRNWAYCISLPATGSILNFENCRAGPVTLPGMRNQVRNPDNIPSLISLRNDGKVQLLALDTSNNITICSYENNTMNCSVTPSVFPAGTPAIEVIPVNLSKQGSTDFYSTWSKITGDSGVMVCNFYNNKIACSNIDNGDRSVTSIGEDPESAKDNPADLNGDGLTDFVYGGTDANNVPKQHVCLSKEKGVDCNSITLGNNIGGYSYLMSGTGDFTGDGVNYFARGDKFCHIVDRETVCEDIDISGATPGASGFGVPGEDKASAMVMDGSGIPSFKWCSMPYREPNTSSDVLDCIAYTAKMPANQDKLTAVVNGVGQREEVDYARGDDASVYSRYATVNGAEQRPVYPQLSNNSGTMAKALRRSNGQGGWISSSYHYAGAMRDALGRGSLGFSKVSSTDANGITTESTFAQTFPFAGTATHVTRAKATCTLEDTTNVPESKSFVLGGGGKNFFVYTKETNTTRHDLDCSDLGSQKTVNQYTDGWGNLKVQTVQVTGSGETHTTTTDSEFDIIGSVNYLSGLPLSVKITKTNARNESLTRTVGYKYNATTGLRDSETIEPDDSTYKVVTSYDRNPFGLVNKQTQSWTDPACADPKWPVSPNGACVSSKSRVVSDVEYDAKGRFAKTMKNALGQTTTPKYDAASGIMVASIDPNNLTITWTLDSFGHVSAERTSDSNETRVYLRSCNGGCPGNATVAKITEHYNGSSRIAAPEVVYLDSAGHAVRTQTWGFDGRKIVVDRRYDALGRPLETDQPRFDNAQSYLAGRQSYDDLNRVLSVTTIDEGGVERTASSKYYGFKVVQTNAKGQTKTEWRNVVNQLYRVDDSNSLVGTTMFEYEPFGNLSKTTDPANNVITVVYDLLGRRTELQDPDLGSIQYNVDPLGQVWAQISSKQRAAGTKTYMAYDPLGRMTARYEQDLESHWIFDTASMGIGKLAEANTQANSKKDYVRSLTYDAFGRPKLTTTQLSDATYSSQVDYDTYGRVSKNTYQRGSGTAKVFDTGYNGMGYLERVQRGSRVLWQITAQDAAMNPTQLALGNGLKQSRSFYPQTGRLQDATLITGANAQRLVEGYVYDQLGNMKQRTQHWDNGGFSESFEYDALNRLHTSQVDNQPVQVFDYDAIGNITSKTDVGNYTYPVSGTGVVRPHGVKTVSSISGIFEYDVNGNVLSGAGESMIWTSFDMPSTITKGGINASFVYGPEHQRVRQDRNDGSSVVYAGAQEIETKAGVVTVKTYWPNGIGVEIDRGSNATEMSWMHVDRLGSVIALTDASGAIREKLEYDVWGKRRSTADNMTTPDSLDGQTDNRGFTGHEMLDQFDLVHMNGRVYNPQLGKFLSGDPFIADPTNGQNYNRYSYVSNNPTNLTDPTGFREDAGQVVTGSYIPQHGEKLIDALMDVEAISRELGGEAKNRLGSKTGEAGQVNASNRTTAANASDTANSANSDKSLQAAGCGQCNRYNPAPEPHVPPPQEGVTSICPECYLIGAGGLIRGAAGKTAIAATKEAIPRVVVSGERSAATEVGSQAAPQLRPGEFSISNWTGYPAGVPKPQGPFRLLGGEEYQAARNAANAANKALRKDINHVGEYDLHEIQPVKFNGSPSSVDNKIILDRSLHRQQVTPWWNALQRALEKAVP